MLSLGPTVKRLPKSLISVPVLCFALLIGCAGGQKDLSEHDRIMEALTLFESGTRFEDQGKYEEAEQIYLESLEISARPVVYYRLGVVQGQLGKYTEALANLDKALDLSPSLEAANRAKIRIEALREIEGSGFAQGEVLQPGEQTGEDEPETAKEEPAPIVPSDVIAEAELEEESLPEEDADLTVPSEGKGTPAIELQPRWEPEPEEVETADEEQAADRPKKESPHVEQTEAVMPPPAAEEQVEAPASLERAQVELLLADAYEAAQKEDFEQAEQHYQEALMLSPDDPRIHYNLGNIYQRQEQFNKAYLRYQRAIELRPDYGRAWNNLGYVLERLNQSKEALDSYEEAIKTEKVPEAYFNMALLLEKTGRLEPALNRFRDYVHRVPYGELADTARVHIKRLERHF